jgi:nicotinate-nucleotide adenylyltransferase
MPIIAPGMRIGLLGGTFNPPHEAHRLVSLFAWKRLALDRIWWLVSPGNPLKDTTRLPPLAGRLARAQSAAASPLIDVTAIEAGFGTRFTHDTLARLTDHFSAVRFVWLMGADILAEFHRWRRWRDLARLVPMAVIDRPGWTLPALASPAATALARSRIDEADAPILPGCEPPAWTFLHGIRSPLSSTALRAGRSPNEG